MMKVLPKCMESSVQKFVRMVSLTIALLLSTGVIASAQQQQQSIQLKFTNATIREVFTYIDNHTDFDFVYNDAQIAALPKVSIDRSLTIAEALQFCLKGSSLGYQIKGKVIVIKPKSEISTGESIKLAGKVIDEHGLPVAGVAILGEGTGRGAVTGPKGEFGIILKRDVNVNLRFSFVGMKPRVVPIIKANELVVRKPQDMVVEMETDVSQIDDIVVTGIMNISRKSFTGSSTTITKDQLKTVSPTNLFQAVQVFDPSFRITENIDMGSNPNALPEMYIRGRSGLGTPSLDTDALSEYSINTNPNLPIYILDGIEVSATRIFDLDMDRIETYTMLKDAAATAMYGSRAANGVVVITTTPPPGGKLSISYNATMTVSLPDLSSYNLMDAREKVEAELRAGFFTPEKPADFNRLEKEYNEKLQAIERGVNTDWIALPLKNAVSHKHSVNLSGGADNFKYLLDVRYDRTNGVMKGNDREKMGADMNLQYSNKGVVFSNTMSVGITKAFESPYGSFSEYTKLNPYDAYLDEQGKILPTITPLGTNQSKRNPMYDTSLNSFNESKYKEFSDNMSVRWYINKKFNVQSQVAFSYKVDDTDKFVDPASGQFSGTKDKGSYMKQNRASYFYDFNAKGFYSDKIGKHYINLVAGINLKEDRASTNTDNFVNFPEGGFSAPGYAAELKSYSRNYDMTRLMGVLGVLNYTYDNIYLFDLSGRIDGSSQFGSNKKYAPFYSGGAGINIHNYKKVAKAMPWLTQLKIRGTYGMTGNVRFPSYAAQNKYSIIQNGWYGTGDGVEITYLGNPNLKWEKTIITDIGGELTLFDGIFDMKYSYYIKDTKDLLADFTIPSSSGFIRYKENVGRLENRGFEIYVSSRVFKNKDWTITVRANGSQNRDKIKEVSNAMKNYNDRVNDYYGSNSGVRPEALNKPVLRYVEGASMSSIFGMMSLGIDPATGKELFMYQDGTTGYNWYAGENVVIGNTQPDFNGSVGTSIRWKGVTLDANFMYEWGGQRYNETLINKVENVDLKAGNADRRVLYDRWVKEGDVSRYLKLQASNRVDRLSTKPTSRFVQDYNLFRLTSLSMGYEFDRSKIEKYGMRRLKVQFNMSDIFTATTVQVERGLSTPFARSFNLSLSASF